MTKILPKDCELAVIGLGRIGLPISISNASKGLKVLGIESNKEMVEKLQNNVVPFQEEGIDKKLEELNNNNFLACFSEDLTPVDVSGIKYVMIAVGVHNIERRYPEPFEYNAIERVVDYLMDIDLLKGRLLILRPTQPIGSTKKVKEMIEQKWNLVEGVDYFISYMPERILEGAALAEEDKLPKIIGTFNESSFQIAGNLLEKLGGVVKRVSTPEVAEFVKLLDNSWRHTKFAFANDAALAAENVGIDANEAIEAANFNYPRNSIALPGPVSGYCLGKDPYIFEYAFRETELSRDFNSIWFYSILSSKHLLDHIVQKVEGSNVLVMGLSFKKNIDDYRLSHGVSIVKKLIDKGYQVTVLDKDYNTNDYTTLNSKILEKIEIVTKIDSIKSDIIFDSVVISVDNNEFKGLENYLIKHNKILDIWGMYKYMKSDFKNYWSLGAPEI